MPKSYKTLVTSFINNFLYNCLSELYQAHNPLDKIVDFAFHVSYK